VVFPTPPLLLTMAMIFPCMLPSSKVSSLVDACRLA
jgi:hypothetical protein